MPPGVSESKVASVVDQVLAPAFLGHLGRMRLAIRRAHGPRPGDTPVRGLVQPSGLELERHKAYTAGDELRFLDWNAYARLDQLLVRQFRAEREAPVHIYLDGSASMASPASDLKFEFAVGLALGMAYVAVRHHNPVRIVVLGEPARVSPTIRFPALLHRLAEFCAGLTAGGPTTLADGIDDDLQTQAGPGLALLISDFLVEPKITRSLLHRLASRGYDVAALRPLGAGERDPSRIFQKARLRDVETGREKVVRLSAENLARYRAALTEHVETLERDCADNEARFAVCDVDAGLHHCFFSRLPQAGVLR